VGYYEALPIYKAAMDLVVALDGAVRKFSRFHKYTLGSQLRESALAVVLQVARGNQRLERDEALQLACQRAEEVKILLNVAKEVKAFHGFNEYVQLMERAVGVAKQAEGWRRSLNRTARPEPGPAGASRARR
jgi:four helix bundle protein